ncbi:OsmC family protein [Alphaproteobacteria bacterium]|nr:OsmC family protein [Alphaproteobacteria bacterium]
MNNKSFTLKFTGNATNKGSMRNDIDVSFESMDETFKLATDEGAFHGGKGTAPPPLALFTASLCGCIMTQIKAFGKKLKIEVSEIKIDASMEWQGQILEEGPYKASCNGYNLDIDIISEEPVQRKKQLLEAAINGCFIEASLKPGIVKHRLKDKNNWITI